MDKGCEQVHKIMQNRLFYGMFYSWFFGLFYKKTYNLDLGLPSRCSPSNSNTWEISLKCSNFLRSLVLILLFNLWWEEIVVKSEKVYKCFVQNCRVLNSPGFWIYLWFWMCQSFGYTRFLNIPLVLNMPAFLIYQSSE